MSKKISLVFRFFSFISIIVLVVSGCSNNAPAIEVEPTQTAVPAPTAAVSSPTPEPTQEAPVVDSNVMFHDDFTNPATNWPEEKFDNFFIGYHEPEYYHVEVDSPNYKTTVFEPDKKSYDDFSLDVKAFTASSKTAETGDFAFGPAFRRSGDQYYAFTISQRTQKWYVLKSTPNALTVLTEGTDDSIHGPDEEDDLKVDAQGDGFSFYINDHLVGQVTDADYPSGEVGFFVQTFDVAQAHVHFDDLTISKYAGVQPPGLGAALFHDDFTNPATNWPEEKFDNFFIGYHEPEYYHVEVDSPNYKTTVFEPEKKSFDNVTIEVKAFTASSKTAETGDFIFGPAFRRLGDQYYAFTISQRTKKWYVLKSTPSALTVLTEGTDDSIHGPDEEDVLKVEAQSAGFSFYINDHLVGQVTDADYPSGEIGFFVQTFDVVQAHVHFDDLTISTYEPPFTCQVKALAMNVRTGPGTHFSSESFLSSGDTVEPVGRTADGDWLLIATDANNNQSWVFNSPGFLSCSGVVDILPIMMP